MGSSGISNRGGCFLSGVSCPNRHWWVFKWLAVVKRVPFGLEIAGVIEWVPVGF